MGTTTNRTHYCMDTLADAKITGIITNSWTHMFGANTAAQGDNTLTPYIPSHAEAEEWRFLRRGLSDAE